jgi:hypothetical protein
MGLRLVSVCVLAGYDVTWREAAISGGNHYEQCLMSGIVMRR